MSFWIRSVVTFSSLVLLLVVGPRLVGTFRMGSSSHGFPFPYYWYDASPPPFSESRFEFGPLVANLLVYLVAAIAFAALVGRVAKK